MFNSVDGVSARLCHEVEEIALSIALVFTFEIADRAGDRAAPDDGIVCGSETGAPLIGATLPIDCSGPR